MDKKRVLCINRWVEGRSFDAASTLTRLLNAQASGIAYKACYFQDLAFVYDGRVFTIFDITDGNDIAEYDAIFMSGWFISSGFESAAMAVAQYAEKRGIPFHNTETLNNRSRSKLSQCVGAVLNDIPSIPFLAILDAQKIPELVAKSGFSFPLVIKSTTASRGADNYLVRNEEELQGLLPAIASKTYLIQPFVENDGDYRLLVMGGKVRLVIHRRTESDSHLNNTSQGGVASMVDLDQLPKSMIDESEKVAQLFNREITGVDMIVDKHSGKHYFLEINNMPQLSTGSFTAEKVSMLDAYFKELISTDSKA